MNETPQTKDSEDIGAQSREDQIRDLKATRKRLDETLQDIKSMPRSRERSISITKLQESIMWLGMALKETGAPNPYPESKNPDSLVVEPTADGMKL